MLKPMLASLEDAPLDDPELVYEPKYDGIRVIAEVPPAGRVRLWSRLGNEKTSQFPEIATALGRWSRRLKAPVVLDGEIVALDMEGQPTGFQQLQGRIHLTDTASASSAPSPLRSLSSTTSFGEARRSASGAKAAASSTAYVVFDILRDGGQDLRDLPLLDRRDLLERLFASSPDPMLRMSEMSRGDGRALYKRALERGWEGLIAKRRDSVYKSGKRTPDWRKLKIVHEQEFVVGGWTEPRQTRTYFGALLLGVYEEREQGRPVLDTHEGHGPSASARGGGAPRELIYVGHTGTGFNERELARVMKLLQPLETANCPFRVRPRTNERPHWVEPKLVAQIKFTEWTADAKLRHPVYLGLRDDKDPREVRREEKSRFHATTAVRLKAETNSGAVGAELVSAPPGRDMLGPYDPERLIDHLQAIEQSRRDGTITPPGGQRLAVTNLHKIFWPRRKLTKGDLFRYYATVAPFILPAVADRPLVMKRFPNGIRGKPFYQHRVEDVPAGVRVETVAPAAMPAGASARRDAHARHQERGPQRAVSARWGARAGVGPREKVNDVRRPQLIGGDLMTLLYMTQLAAISQDPWFSRVQSPEYVDYVAFDLDPMPGLGFNRVLEVARWIHDELETLGASGVPKTSGSEGLHVYVPLPPETPYEAGLMFCQIVATVVANKHSKHATVERAVARRGKRVYIDYLQNILGKTLATAYSARASDYAGVSTPLTWDEVHEGIEREAFTITSVPERVREVGDLWAVLRTTRPIDLSRIARYADGTGRGGRLKGERR